MNRRAVRIWSSAAMLVALSCSGADMYEYRPPGQVTITAEPIVRNCPRIRHYTVAPIQTSVGGRIAVSAAVQDGDAGTVQVRWTGKGEFEDPRALDTTYTCTVAGYQQIVLTVANAEGCDRVEKIGVTCM